MARETTRHGDTPSRNSRQCRSAVRVILALLVLAFVLPTELVRVASISTPQPLLDPNAASDRLFGRGVAVSADGTTLAVRAYGINGDRGKVYVYVKSGGSFPNTPTSTLADPDPNAVSSEQFGLSIALSANGSVLVAGADGASGNRGAAYVYRRAGGRYALVTTLSDPAATSGDSFGFSIALAADGATLAVGAKGTRGNQGAAYVYASGDGGFPTAPTTTLTDPAATSNGFFGFSVALAADGLTLAVGAIGPRSYQGTAYIYTRSGGFPSIPTKTLGEPNSTDYAYFGGSVTLSGDGSLLAVGADGTHGTQGNVYIYTRGAGGFPTLPTTTLADPATPPRNDYLGRSVVLSADGNTLAVGADDTNAYRGAVYLYTRSAGAFPTMPTTTLTDPAAANNDFFGFSIALAADGTTLAVGAYGTDGNYGAAYVYAGNGAIGTATASPTQTLMATASPTASSPTPAATVSPTATAASTSAPMPSPTPSPTSARTVTPAPTVAPTATPTASVPAPTTLLGVTTLGELSDVTDPGSAAAFRSVAAASGTANTITLFLDFSNRATTVIVGLYADSGGNPGTLLTQGTITAPRNNAWNSVSVPATMVTMGTTYWIAVLSPVGAGQLWVRDVAQGDREDASRQTTLTTLPGGWTSGGMYANSPVSAYITGTSGMATPVPTPTPTPTALPTSTSVAVATATPTTAPTSPPTQTPMAPPTPTAAATSTAVPTATFTPRPVTATPVPTSAPSATATAAATPTRIPTPIPLPTATRTATPAAPPLGTMTIGDTQDYTIPGTANAFQLTASATSTLNTLAIYLDATGTATTVVLGVYSDRGGGPGTLLTQGTITAPVNGSWNRVTVSPTTVVAGTLYWLVVLAPNGGGTIQFRDTEGGGPAIVSAQTALTSLPTTWQSGERYPGSPPSAYGASG